jgi:hypothetical protein
MAYFKSIEDEQAFLADVQAHPLFEPLLTLLGTSSVREVEIACDAFPILLTDEMDQFIDYWVTTLLQDSIARGTLEERRRVIANLRLQALRPNTLPTPIDGVPFTPFRSRVKAVRFDRMNVVQKAALEFAFPHFFREELSNPRWVRKADPFHSSADGTEPAFRYRRFAGGSSLPSNRYYSVCEADTGQDSQTLAQEIMSYAEWPYSPAFTLNLVDLAESQNGDLLETLWGIRGPADQIAMIFQWQTPSPPPELAFLQSFLRPDRQGVPVLIPTALVDLSIPRTIDLRMPDTQRWLVSHVFNGLPNVMFTAGGVLNRGLPLGDGKDQPWPIDEPFVTRGGLEMFSYPPAAHRYRVSSRLHPDFIGMLEFLMHPTRGGSPLTDTIGRWLRSLGTSALVYPSARANVECIIEDRRLKRWRGWNLVDYRELEPLEERATVIHEPHSWRGLYGGTEIVRGGGRLAGSFMIRGVVEAQRRFASRDIARAGEPY